ncbi:MAG: class I SAM-dependent methyltransferase, partial [Candidatus Omnitrophica bacterium]|nr:class I SAM-dependent methyltransferase [Candidatus Omnitrophota bacterium]
MKQGIINRQNITGDDFSKAFNCPHDEIPKEVISCLNNINTAYRKPDVKELEEYVLYVLKSMNSDGSLRSNEENYNAWEKGWKEHLVFLSAENFSEQYLKPKYFRPSRFLRYKKDIIVIDNPDLEYELFTVARHLLFLKYLSGVDHIYELGCGSCQNLLMLSRLFPLKSLYGLDWSEASIKIAESLKKNIDKKIEGIKFN